MEPDGPREGYRWERKLQEERKAGRIPAERDEEGKEINPHIPNYIAKAPWYINTGHPSLKHQKSGLKESTTVIDSSAHHKRGFVDLEKPVTKFRKGACENCGAITHKTRDCLDRPRQKGAKWTGLDIKPDEFIEEAKLDFESKRDRWSGYNPEEYEQVIESHERIEEERRKLKELGSKVGEGDAATTTNEHDYDEAASEASSPNNIEPNNKFDVEDDEEKYAERVDMPGQKVDLKTRMTVRNLRIREDTAKYLLNLDLDSAYYDPKTRSMRGNPQESQAADALETNNDFINTGGDGGVGDVGGSNGSYKKSIINPTSLFAGDNFVRSSGDATKIPALQMFAWQAAQRGAENIHMQANPSLTEYAHREYERQRKAERQALDQELQAVYGSGISSTLTKPTTANDKDHKTELNESTDPVPDPSHDPALRCEETEVYVEYNGTTGKISRVVKN